MPLVVAGIVDVGIPEGDRGIYMENVRGNGAVGRDRTCLLPYGAVFCSAGGHGLSTALRADLFAHINRLSYRELDSWELPHW